MLAKRIIPCLDIKDGQTVKGVNFENLRDAGDPLELADAYVQQGADELVFLDITATVDQRKTLAELVKKVAMRINIPFTVGGGISSVADVEVLLSAGADKVSINSAAVENPDLINQLALEFGSQCVVLAIDTNFIDDLWTVYVHGGRTRTEISTIEWAKQAQERGAGEILLTSMNNDGTKAGFALNITKELSTVLNIPIIASGGAGSVKHFIDVFKIANADAALAASIFHYGEILIPDLKQELDSVGVEIRL